jgi:hypothetical protein
LGSSKLINAVAQQWDNGNSLKTSFYKYNYWETLH